VTLLKLAHRWSICISVVCADLVSTYVVCGNFQLECLLFISHQSGFGSKLILLPQVWGKICLQMHAWSSPLPFGEEDVHQSCLQARRSSTRSSTFALRCWVSNSFTRVVPVFFTHLRIFLLVSFYSTFEMQELLFILKALKITFCA